MPGFPPSKGVPDGTTDETPDDGGFVLGRPPSKVVPFLCPGQGDGSAYGGKWTPKNKFEQRLLGKPGEIKVS
ncbi:MAG: hypothetical protein RR444_13435, partial [Oscillospiraceae bacterium]